MARKKKDAPVAGKMSIDQIRGMINKHAGCEVAFDMREENPSDVSAWIPTGSRWLDGIVCLGKMAGIPVGRISEIAGEPSSGKSYMALQIAINAQKMGMDVVYFDSESAMSTDFCKAAGIDFDKFIYLQATSLEFVFEIIEQILAQSNTQTLFILDSLANCPTLSEIEDGNYNPKADMAPLARVSSKGMKKLVSPIANHKSTFLVLNQLKTKINTVNPAMTKYDPWFTPGGMATTYSYSLRIWLTRRAGIKHQVEDENGFRVGSHMKCKLKKNRFGCENRECEMRINWGANGVFIHDRESWLEAIAGSPHYSGGQWKSITMEDGTEMKFQNATWLDKLENDQKFYDRAIQILDEQLIDRFARREGSAKAYYSIDGDEDGGKKE